ncbi:MAG: DUF4340 domain-containing protein [Bacteroidales bacterium]|nr:DUF4340 domain-containing protein [Bacteroidales bacterium]
MLSKFLNTKTLIILLVILGGIYLITTLNKGEDRTFKSQLVDVDTSQVTKIKIIPSLGSDNEEITFTRTGEEWKLEADGKFFKPEVSSIKNILTELLRMRTERVSATSEEKWKELEVTDSTASRVQLFAGDDKLTDIYIGKFSYTQAPQQQQNPYQRQQTRMFTNIREAGDETVYVVEGFIKMNIQPKVDSYRAKTLVSVQKENITKVSFNYPDDQFTVTNENGNWFLNGQPADSLETTRYLQKFSRLTNSNYADDVEMTTNTPSHTITIEANNSVPVELKAFPADTTTQYIITTSRIPDTKFEGGKSRLFERIFVGRSEFFKKTAE